MPAAPSNLLDKMEVVVEGGVLKIRPEKRNSMFNWNFGSERQGDASRSASRCCPKRRSPDRAGSRSTRSAAPTSRAKSPDRATCAWPRSTPATVELSIAGSGDVTRRRQGQDASPMRSPDRATSTPRAWSPKPRGVSIAGSGNVGANATGTADVEIVGSGDVDMTGGAKCTIEQAWLGRRRLLLELSDC